MKSGQRGQSDAPNDRPRPQATSTESNDTSRSRQPNPAQPHAPHAAISQADGEP